MKAGNSSGIFRADLDWSGEAVQLERDRVEMDFVLAEGWAFIHLSQGSRHPDFILLSLFDVLMGCPCCLNPPGSPLCLHILGPGGERGEEAGV